MLMYSDGQWIFVVVAFFGSGVELVASYDFLWFWWCTSSGQLEWRDFGGVCMKREVRGAPPTPPQSKDVHCSKLSVGVNASVNTSVCS